MAHGCGRQRVDAPMPRPRRVPLLPFEAGIGTSILKKFRKPRYVVWQVELHPVQGSTVSGDVVKETVGLPIRCLASLGLQLAVTAAEAEAYVLVLGCGMIDSAFHVRGMPRFRQDMVDFIRPKYLGNLKAVFDYLLRFHLLPVLPAVIIFSGLQEYIREASTDPNGDQTIASLFAMLKDFANFATAKTGQQCRLFVSCHDGPARAGLSLCPTYVTLPFFAFPWRCDPEAQGSARFHLVHGGPRPTTLRFRREGRQLCFEGVTRS